MRVLDEPPLTWDEWKENIPKRQFDRDKFTALALVEKDEQVKNLICEIADHILSVSNPMKILLFGSRARGDSTQYSDIDIAVIFKRKRDITVKFNKLISTLKETSPMDVDFKSADIRQVKDCRENMADMYYYIMRDSIIIYQQGDNDLYEFLEIAHIHLKWHIGHLKSKTAFGLDPYYSIQHSLGAVFLAGHRPMPANKSNLRNIADQLPTDWNVSKCDRDELDYIASLKTISNIDINGNIDDDKNPSKSYKISKKIYESVLNECIKRDLLSKDKIKNLK